MSFRVPRFAAMALRRTSVVIVMLATVAVVPSPTAHGETVLSNLSNTLGRGTLVHDTEWIANSFRTDNQSWLLNSVSVLMGDPLVLGPDGPGFFSVSVWSDNNSVAPETLLQTLVGPGNPSTAGTYTYSASGSGLALDPLTKYWLVTSTANTGLYWYAWSSTYDNATSGGWTIPVTNTRNASDDGGVTWNGADDAEPQMFSIEATLVPSAVPEIDPNSLGSVLALVLGSLGLLERRRLKAA